MILLLPSADLLIFYSQICLKVVTSSTKDAAGGLNVFVDSGDGYVKETDDEVTYKKGQVIMEKCYNRIEGIQVAGPSTNAWAGIFSISLDG